MKMKQIKIVILSLLSLWGSSAFAQLTPQDAIAQMKRGINLGNTLEAPLEGDWVKHITQEYQFDMYKESGFDFIRIPVRWDMHTQSVAPYKVDEKWMKRVEEIVDWGLERGLIISINAHHEEWIKSNYSTENKARFDSIWTQISTYFKDKSERLLFEIINEPYGLTKSQNDDLHARIIQIIRKTNPTRNIIIQGHNWGGSDELVTAAIPDDPYIIGSFHSYDPYLFGLEAEGTWGTTSDFNSLKSKFQKVKDWSTTNNIPIFLGEFGSLRSCDYNSRMKHYKAYMELSHTFGFAPCAWDDGGDFKIMNRAEKTWDEVKDILIYCGIESPSNLKIAVYQDSTIRLAWTNNISDNDSIIIQRRLSTDESYDYKDYATLEKDATSFLDVKPEMNKTYHYRIIAKYNDESKKPVYSNPIRIFFPKWEIPERSPFHGEALPIPGVIEAEDFDNGGNGYSYFDSSEDNIGGEYRPTDEVDIYAYVNENEYYVGNLNTDEWLEYTVNVAEDGIYTANATVFALVKGGQFSLKIGDVESEIISVTVPKRPDLKVPIEIPFEMDLKAGEQIMRFSVVTCPPLFNIDKITIDKKTGFELADMNSLEISAISKNGTLYVTDKNGGSIKDLKIYSTNGALIRHFANCNDQTIEINELEKGVYIIEGSSNKDRSIKKLIL